jgi:uncharacterized protein with GYD domain
MKTYIILTTLTEEGKKRVMSSPEKMKLSAESVEHRGGEIIEQYALLGPYDFLTIIRVKDERAIYRITSEMGALGTVKTVTLPAISIDAFINDIQGGAS